jgi:Leucine-rich repeat (LRR) protein
LAHNKLRQVPSRVFSHLTLLNSLELDGNNIDTIDPEAFAGLEGKILHKKKKKPNQFSWKWNNFAPELNR